MFLKALVKDPRVEVGDHTYDDDPDDPLGFERRAVLYDWPIALVTEHAARSCPARLRSLSASPSSTSRSRPATGAG